MSNFLKIDQKEQMGGFLKLDHDNTATDGSGQFMDNGEQKPNLIINYVPQSLSEESFRGMFMPYGEITHCKLMVDKVTGAPCGYGFVEYATLEEARKAIQGLNGMEISGKRLKVSFSRPPGDNIKDANLYMKGLPLEWNDDMLHNLVAKFGNIVQTRVLRDKQTGVSKGVGFVLFSQRSQAQDCMNTLNGTELPGSSEKLLVKPADDNKAKNNAKGPQNAGGPQGGWQNQGMMGHNNGAQGMPHKGGQWGGGGAPHQPGMMAPFMMQGGGGPGGNYHGGPGGYPPNPMQQNGGMPGLDPSGWMASSAYPAPQPFGAQGGQSGPVRGYQKQAGNMRFNPMNSNLRVVGNPPVGGGMKAPGAAYGGAPKNGGGFGPQAHNQHGENGYVLFVYNVGTTCEEGELYKLFSPYGAINKLDLVRDKSNNQTKFAFVTMSTLEAAESAIHGLNGYALTQKPLQVSFKT